MRGRVRNVDWCMLRFYLFLVRMIVFKKIVAFFDKDIVEVELEIVGRNGN